MNENDILLKVFRMVQNWSERVNIGPRTDQTKFGNHCMSRTCVSRFLEQGDIVGNFMRLLMAPRPSLQLYPS